MKLPIGCLICNPLKHEYYRFLIPIYLRLEGNVPPPPRNGKVEISGQCYRQKSFQERSSGTFYNVPPQPPFQFHYLILRPNPKKLVKSNFKLIWIYGLKPNPPPLSSPKNEMLIFGLCSTSDDQPGWSKDSNPICHLSPAKKMKCSFLDYVQLLMIGRAGQWT